MKKKIIIIISINVLIVIAILGLIVFLSSHVEQEVVEEKPQSVQSATKSVSDNVEVFTVQKYIQDFFEQININNELYYTGDERLEQSFISEWTYSLLSTEYIDKNSITIENVYEHVYKVEEKLIFVPLKMNVLELESTTKYAIYGFCQTGDNEYRGDIYVILNVDNNNNTFSIEPLQNINSIDEIELTNNNLEIEPNRYNTYEEQEVTEEYICEQYLYIFKRLMLCKTEESFDYLNETYRDAKFESLQSYTEYVEENRDKIARMTLKAYSINDNKYICKNQWDNYYIFNVNAPLDYNVMLDIYTVDIDEFKEQYNNTTNENKVAMNVQKIISAINNKDYEYVYNKLDETFKNNNFGNLENFEKYMEENFFEVNEASSDSITNQGNIYIYNINLIDVNNETNTKSLTIIMKLLDDLDFTMSFSM